jgi:hypothetical protein
VLWPLDQFVKQTVSLGFCGPDCSFSEADQEGRGAKVHHVQIEVLIGRRPLIPLQEHAGLLARTDDEAIRPIVLGVEVVPAIVVGILVSAVPVSERFVAGPVRPKDTARIDRQRRPVVHRFRRRIARVAAAGVGPDHRVVDDLNALADQIGIELRDALGSVDADERQLGIRRQLVDDLGDGGAMLAGVESGEEPGVAVVLYGVQRSRQIAAGLPVEVPLEVLVDDGDLLARTPEAGEVLLSGRIRRPPEPERRACP